MLQLAGMQCRLYKLLWRAALEAEQRPEQDSQKLAVAEQELSRAAVALKSSKATNTEVHKLDLYICRTAGLARCSHFLNQTK